MLKRQVRKSPGAGSGLGFWKILKSESRTPVRILAGHSAQIEDLSSRFGLSVVENQATGSNSSFLYWSSSTGLWRKGGAEWWGGMDDGLEGGGRKHCQGGMEGVNMRVWNSPLEWNQGDIMVEGWMGQKGKHGCPML